MGKFVIRIGWCGFAIVCLLVLLARWLNHSGHVPALVIVLCPLVELWPPGILPGSLPAAPPAFFPYELFALGVSAFMNGAFYAGLAWLIWWAARLAGIAKAGLGEKERIISALLAICLSFTALMILAEVVIHPSRKLGGNTWLETYAVSANFFALIVLTCALAGWAFWWILRFLTRRGAAGPA